ncbi:MAG: ABC transporter permease [Deltaproteobacteria bacterium]|nr:MAG: ABC transporter permease [Deltaproteobacteria bacterium]
MSAISSEQRSATEPKVLPTLPSVHWTERYFRFLWGTVGIVGCLLLWQLGSSTEVLDPLFVSSPLEVLRTALRLLPSPEFLGHLFITTQCLFLGLSIALVVGVVVGLPIGWFPRLNATFEPVIAAVYGVPYIAFLPVIIMWTGIGMTSRVIIVFWSAVFPLIINSIQGAREVDDNFLRVITLPSSVPYILAGLRTSIGRAIVGVVVAEFFMSSKGLGYFINLKANALEMAPAFVAIVLLALFGITLVSIVTYIENRFCNW